MNIKKDYIVEYIAESIFNMKTINKLQITSFLKVLEIFKTIFKMDVTNKPVTINELKDVTLFPILIKLLLNEYPLNLRVKVINNYSYFNEEKSPILFIAKEFYIPTGKVTPIYPLNEYFIDKKLNKITVSKKYNGCSYSMKIHYFDEYNKKRFKVIDSYYGGYDVSLELSKIDNLIMTLKIILTMDDEIC